MDSRLRELWSVVVREPENIPALERYLAYVKRSQEAPGVDDSYARSFDVIDDDERLTEDAEGTALVAENSNGIKLWVCDSTNSEDAFVSLTAEDNDGVMHEVVQWDAAEWAEDPSLLQAILRCARHVRAGVAVSDMIPLRIETPDMGTEPAHFSFADADETGPIYVSDEGAVIYEQAGWRVIRTSRTPRKSKARRIVTLEVQTLRRDGSWRHYEAYTVRAAGR